jgi:hypothetical protein
VAADAGDVDLARRIVSGSCLVALGTPTVPATIGASVSADLSITDVAGAELILVCDASGAALLRVVDCDSEPIDAIDGTVTAARGRATGVAAVAFVDASSVVFERALVLAAATSVGIAQGVLAVAVRYAGQRQQFGKAIGAYQAIKHRCVDNAVLADAADAQVFYAAVAVQEGLVDALTEASIAKYGADEAARKGGEGAVQVHGAMGYTSEATPYRFVLRAHVLARSVALRAELLDTIVGDRSSAPSVVTVG